MKSRVQPSSPFLSFSTDGNSHGPAVSTTGFRWPTFSPGPTMYPAQHHPPYPAALSTIQKGVRNMQHKPQILTGFVKYFEPNKRYGFIAGDDGNDYFFHELDIRDGAGFPEKNAQVEFEVGSNRKGVCARNVIIL